MTIATCHLCRSTELTVSFQAVGHRYLRCGRCSLIAREGTEAARVTADYATDAYQCGDHPSPRLELREALFHQALDALNAHRRRLTRNVSGRLLDVGCGDGLFLKLAAKQGWEGWGVELSPTACELARQQSGCRIHCGALASAHFPAGHFDAVTLFNVLDQLPDPLAELREIYRVLKPGGLLMVRVPNGLFHAGLRRLLPMLERQLVFHLYCLTPRTLTALLAVADFQAIEVDNSPLTPADPYGVSPVLGDAGMAWIKRAVFGAAQLAAALTGGRRLVGPSLLAWAVKPRSSM
jgi:SAM-dependent methyltransferase